MYTQSKYITYILVLVAVLFLGVFYFASAQSVDGLKEKISEREQAIADLEKEIQQYNRQIVSVQAEKQTLSYAVRELDLTRQKLLTDIAVTDNKIEATEFAIRRIQSEINTVESRMDTNTKAISEYVRSMDALDDRTLLEVVLGSDELSEFWNKVENLQQFRAVVSENLRELELFKKQLETKKQENEQEIQELESLEDTLSDQKQVVEIQKNNKDTLLQKTKSKESEYQRILSEKKAAKEAFEQELAEYESQLQFILDKDKLPSSGSGVLGWPLADVGLQSCYEGGAGHANCITQFFGNTQFAQSGAYNGEGHNGMDFRASVGSPVYATANGTIQGTGDTDAYPGCYSYGQWILISHDNGLATLYAHLSLRDVSSGQYVRKGELIGYSGNTGYSTGPHLHLTVYAAEAVEILKLSEWRQNTNCGGASIPVAAYNAYLNPLDYLAK